MPQSAKKSSDDDTLAASGLEEPFFQLCCCVSVFWFWQEIGFGVTYVLRVQCSCGVVLVIWFWQEIVFGFAYVLSVQYSCAVVSVFYCGGKEFSRDLRKILISNTAYLFLELYGSTTLQSR